MTIYNLPNVGFEEFDLKPVIRSEVSNMEGRLNEVADFGEPYWTLNAQTNFLDLKAIGELEVFFMQATKGNNTFLVHNIHQPRPAAYNTPLTIGVGSVAGVTDKRQVDIQGLQANLELNIGDYIEFQMSNTLRSLHRITQAVTLSSTGTGTINFEYPLNTNVFTTSSAVIFEKPSCLMKLEGNPSIPKSWNSREASFSAMEYFYDT